MWHTDSVVNTWYDLQPLVEEDSQVLGMQERFSIQGVPKIEYAVKVGDLQWVRIPSGQSVARPEAIRAPHGGNDMW